MKKDTGGKVIEKPEDLFKRVANNIALADAKYLLKEEIAGLDDNQEYFELVKTKAVSRLVEKKQKSQKTAGKNRERIL